jgi:predicted nuclease of predicted toxin-antitoxin system
VKLLFDANISHKLVRHLAGEYSGSTHVRDVGLQGAEDREIWDHARTHGFVIVSKDIDFRERSYVEGIPAEGHLARCRQCRHGGDCSATAR